MKCCPNFTRNNKKYLLNLILYSKPSGRAMLSRIISCRRKMRTLKPIISITRQISHLATINRLISKFFITNHFQAIYSTSLICVEIMKIKRKRSLSQRVNRTIKVQTFVKSHIFLQFKALNQKILPNKRGITRSTFDHRLQIKRKAKNLMHQPPRRLIFTGMPSKLKYKRSRF